MAKTALEGSFKSVINGILAPFGILILVLSTVTAVESKISQASALGLSIAVLVIAAAWALYVWKAKIKPITHADILLPKYGWRTRWFAILLALASCLPLVLVSGVLAKEMPRGHLPVLIINYMTADATLITPKADFFIKKPSTPLTDEIIATGIIDLDTENKMRRGPWLLLAPGDKVKIKCRIRNPARFVDLLHAGEFDMDVVFQVNSNLVHKTILFSVEQLGRGILLELHDG